MAAVQHVCDSEDILFDILSLNLLCVLFRFPCFHNVRVKG